MRPKHNPAPVAISLASPVWMAHLKVGLQQSDNQSSMHSLSDRTKTWFICIWNTRNISRKRALICCSQLTENVGCNYPECWAKSTRKVLILSNYYFQRIECSKASASIRRFKTSIPVEIIIFESGQCPENIYLVALQYRDYILSQNVKS